MSDLLARARSVDGGTLLLSPETAASVTPSGDPDAFREAARAAGMRAVMSAVAPPGLAHVMTSTGAIGPTFAVTGAAAGRPQEIVRLNAPVIARADRLPDMPASDRAWRWVPVSDYTDARSLAALVQLSAAGEAFFLWVRSATGMQVAGIELTLRLARDCVAGLSFAATLRSVSRRAPRSAVYLTRDHAYALSYMVECGRCAVYERHRDTVSEAAWVDALQRASAVACEIGDHFPGAALTRTSGVGPHLRDEWSAGLGVILDLLTRWKAQHPFWPADAMVLHPDVARDLFGADTERLRELTRATMRLELASDASVDGFLLGRRNALPCWNGLDMLAEDEDPRIAEPSLDRVTWYELDRADVDNLIKDEELSADAALMATLRSAPGVGDPEPSAHWRKVVTAQVTGVSRDQRLALVAEAVTHDPGLSCMGAASGYPYDVRAILEPDQGLHPLGDQLRGEILWVRVVAAAPTPNVWIAEMLTASSVDPGLAKSKLVTIVAHPAGCRVLGPWSNGDSDLSFLHN